MNITSVEITYDTLFYKETHWSNVEFKINDLHTFGATYPYDQTIYLIPLLNNILKDRNVCIDFDESTGVAFLKTTKNIVHFYLRSDRENDGIADINIFFENNKIFKDAIQGLIEKIS